MIEQNNLNLNRELKQLIIDTCGKIDYTPDDIDDEEALFSNESKLELDSMDALQISMAINEKYKIKITDSKKLRKIMTNINSLAHYIEGQ